MPESSSGSRSPTANDIAERGGLKRTLNKWHLTALGVGATIGAGIFATTGTAIAGRSRLAVRRPGDHLLLRPDGGGLRLRGALLRRVRRDGPHQRLGLHLYAYASLGEFVAWIIGWDLIVEYAVGNIGVAIGWSGYFRELLSHWARPSASLPPTSGARMTRRRASAAPIDATSVYPASANTHRPAHRRVPGHRQPPRLLLGGRGDHGDPGDRVSRNPANSNNAMVLLKIGIILFLPRRRRVLRQGRELEQPRPSGFAPNGFAGISAAAAIIFFSYIGFDVVSTAAEEAGESWRACPSGSSPVSAITTVLYIALSVVMTGLAPWQQLGTPEPMITSTSVRRRAARDPQDVAAHHRHRGGDRDGECAAGLPAGPAPHLHVDVPRRASPPIFGKVHPRSRRPTSARSSPGLFVATFAASWRTSPRWWTSPTSGPSSRSSLCRLA
ncbi:MAG: amino acid permease [Gemmatimonadales bacterium]